MITRIRLGFLILALLVTGAVAAAGYLYAQLDTSNASLRSTEAELHTTGEALAATQRDLATTVHAFTEERLTRNRLQQELHQTQADLSKEQSARNHIQQDNAALLSDKATLTSSLSNATADNAALTANLADAAFLESELRMSLSDAETKYAALNRTKDRITDERDALMRKVGTIESLQEQQTALQAEIADLQEKRRPLILGPNHTETSGFACTGSMEPKLTCLDTATWLSDFKPADIVVGATISFASNACWPDEHASSRHAHRVTNLRTVNGQPEYLTKGDANREPDCWVPFSAVDAYIIAIQKNTVPENAKLRNYVNEAKAAYDTQRAAWDTKKAAYDTARDHYLALRTRHGCPANPQQVCYASGNAYSELLRGYNQLETARKALNARLPYLKEALRYHNCWLSIAERSGPGFIAGLCVPFPVVVVPELPSF